MAKYLSVYTCLHAAASHPAAHVEVALDVLVEGELDEPLELAEDVQGARAREKGAPIGVDLHTHAPSTWVGHGRARIVRRDVGHPDLRASAVAVRVVGPEPHGAQVAD